MERNFSIFIFKEKEKLVQRSFVAILTEFYFFAKIKKSNLFRTLVWGEQTRRRS